MSGQPSLEYDPEADAIYVWLAAPGTVSTRTEVLDDARTVDYDNEGTPIGIEFLGVSRGLNLVSVPDAEAIGELLARLPGIRAVA